MVPRAGPGGLRDHALERACGDRAILQCAGVRYRPLGSPWACPNVLFRGVYRCRHASFMRCRWRVYRGWCGQGGYWEGGIPGVLPTHPPGIPLIGIARAQLMAQERPVPHAQALQGPPGPSAHLDWTSSSIPASGPNRARFSYIYLKVSQNRGVSPFLAHEACHTPCFKNRSKYHDLEFPKKGIWPAFSHKE